MPMFKVNSRIVRCVPVDLHQGSCWQVQIACLNANAHSLVSNHYNYIFYFSNKLKQNKSSAFLPCANWVRKFLFKFREMFFEETEILEEIGSPPKTTWLSKSTTWFWRCWNNNKCRLVIGYRRSVRHQQNNRQALFVVCWFRASSRRLFRSVA